MPTITTENEYKELVTKLANSLIEVTATGSIAVMATGSARGTEEDATGAANQGNNGTAGAAAATPQPASDGQIPAQVYASAGVPKTKIKTSKYMFEGADVQDIANLVLQTSQDDLENPLKKNKPTVLGTELSQ